MRQTILGLDLGPTSIGWAYLEEPDWKTGEAGRVIGAGSRIFPEGVDRPPTGGEKSKNQDRRTARAMRRQLRRRRARRTSLRAALVEADLLPANDDPAAVTAFDACPYELRARALDDRLDPFEIGRVLLHLSQRRGFLSNRKTDAGDSEMTGMLGEMSSLADAMETRGARTLGEYLHWAGRDARNGDETDSAKVRGRHTRRSMLIEEFDAIWRSQQRFHPDLLTDELRWGSVGQREYPVPPARRARDRSILELHGIEGMAFFQRSLWWPKEAVGVCELQQGNPRCERADRDAQRFRILTEVNNLRVVELDEPDSPSRPLTDAERDKLLTMLMTPMSTSLRKWDAIKKKLGLDPELRVFNMEIAGNRQGIKGHETDGILTSKSRISKERWASFDEATRTRVVRVLLSNTPDAEARRALVDECGLTSEEADNAMRANLGDGRASYSRRAIRKLLPYLEAGLPLTGKTGEDNALHAAGYVRADERSRAEFDELPAPPDAITNPIVRAALFEVRKVVNGIIREHGKPDVIRIEMARNLRMNGVQREKFLKDQATRTKLRDEARSQIREFGFKDSRDAVNRWLIWKEQGETCIYSGAPIGITQLFGGDVDLDHILPRHRSLDDSLANKVVAFSTENREKGKRTVGEWLATANPAKFDRVQQLARLHDLPYGKRKKLAVVDIELDDFVSRQLTDTTFIAREVLAYVKQLGTDVTVSRGQLTSKLRHYWQLDSILDSEGRGEKNRADHRHHAVDAFVVALTDRKALQTLSRAWSDDKPDAWPGFRTLVEEAVDEIVVAHKPSRKISGALHEETVYGRAQSEGDGVFVRRKPVGAITNPKLLAKVRDTGTRRALERHLLDRDVDPATGPYPKGIFEGENAPRKLTKDGSTGPLIKSVRLLENKGDVRPRGTGYVQPGNNHHVKFFAPENGGGKWIAHVTPVWDAAQRVRCGDGTLIDRAAPKDGYRFLFSLCKNEAFEMLDPADPESGRRVVAVVRKLDRNSSGTALEKLFFRLHTDARTAGELKPLNLYVSTSKFATLAPRKVAVSPTGVVRYAND